VRFASGGEAGYKQWALQRFLNDPRQNDRAINVASAYAFAGNRDRALQFLRKASQQGDPRLKCLVPILNIGFVWRSGIQPLAENAGSA